MATTFSITPEGIDRLAESTSAKLKFLAIQEHDISLSFMTTMITAPPSVAEQTLVNADVYPESSEADSENDVTDVLDVLDAADRDCSSIDFPKVLMAAQLEDLMSVIEEICHDLGIDAANYSNLLIPPTVVPMSFEIMRDLLCTYEILAEASDCRVAADESGSMDVQDREDCSAALRRPWDPLGVDNYDHALSKLFKHAEQLDPRIWLQTLDPSLHMTEDSFELFKDKLAKLDGLSSDTSFSIPACLFLKIEPPLCLSNDCLAKLKAKLASLNQDYNSRRARIRAMEQRLRSIYEDLKINELDRVAFLDESTVKYAAMLGRELLSLEHELDARERYLSGEYWPVLDAIWNSCLVSEQERAAFKKLVDQQIVSYVAKMDKIQSELENCRSRFSKHALVYRLMISRSKVVESMIEFEKTANDPERLKGPSFRLLEEARYRKNALPTLLNLEKGLLAALEQFEKDTGEAFMFEGNPYRETLLSEIKDRHVDEAAFARFSSKIAAPTRNQTIRIMGHELAPLPTPVIPLPAPRQIRSKSLRRSMPAPQSPDSPRRLNTSLLKTPVSPPPSYEDALTEAQILLGNPIVSLQSRSRESSVAPSPGVHSRAQPRSSIISPTPIGSNPLGQAKSSVSSISSSTSTSVSSSPMSEHSSNCTSISSYFSSPTTSASPMQEKAFSPKQEKQPVSVKVMSRSSKATL
ncbi:hypothetical protein BGW38_000181 [Lunasporangiospora selenospora]|uniref:Uncharacterized protein n=1 Tax=Lunasporangiospora selenospora TaxID=979761 RepID=A0A9P6KF75_9FUNG|nr:hypothetical protein BGW38_000181 [Lunasporangiospora selenospora]